jgi:hypothetical protein
MTEVAAFKPEWKAFSLPPPSSHGSLEMADEVVSLRKMFLDLSDNQIFRIRHEDEVSTTTLFVEALEQFGFKVSTKLAVQCAKAERDVVAIVAKYKSRYNRMRPQEWIKLKKKKTVFPVSVSAEGGSYPSTRATVGGFMALYLSTKFPRATPTLHELGRQVGWNRVRAGWNYRSDYAMGRVLAEHLWKHFDEKGLK